MATPTLEQVARGDAALNAFLGLTDTQLLGIAALASNLYLQGQVEDALTLFEGLTAVQPSLYYGHAGLGAIALARGDAAAAVAHLTTAAKLNPADASVQANLGEALLRSGDVAAAAEPLGRALELDPEGRDEGANRARAILQSIGALDQSIARLEAAAA
ncbi:MAG: tetratricopeptide repeat protein [Bryobacteraceae bacterium]